MPVVERPRAKTRAPKPSAMREMSAPMPYEPPKTTIVLPASCSRYAASPAWAGAAWEASWNSLSAMKTSTGWVTFML